MLRASVTYDDDEDTGKSAVSTHSTVLSVQVATPTLTPGDGSLEVAWVGTGVTASAPEWYEVEYKRVADVSRSRAPDVPHPTTKTTISGLVNGDLYDARVRACNSGGCGAWSQLAFATPQAKLDAPTGLDIVPLPLRKARLTWTASANSDANTEASIWVADSAGVGSECSAGWCEVADGLTDLSVGHVIKLDDVANSKGLAHEDSFDIRIVATISTGTKLDSGASDEIRIRDNPLRLAQNALSRTGLVQTPILSYPYWFGTFALLLRGFPISSLM